MKHLIAMVFKFIITAILLEIILGILTALGFGRILTISLVTTILAYLIVDLLILPASNNTVSTLSDAVISFVIIYLFNFAAGYGGIHIAAALISAVVLAGFEWFFHKYMAGLET